MCGMSISVCACVNMSVTIFPWVVDVGYGIIYEKSLTKLAVQTRALMYLPSK